MAKTDDQILLLKIKTTCRKCGVRTHGYLYGLPGRNIDKAEYAKRIKSDHALTCKVRPKSTS